MAARLVAVLLERNFSCGLLRSRAIGACVFSLVAAWMWLKPYWKVLWKSEGAHQAGVWPKLYRRGRGAD